jgi:hypothetical protein
MKTLQTIGLLLLLSTFSSAYAGDCFKDDDVADCRVKAEQELTEAQLNLGVLFWMIKSPHWEGFGRVRSGAYEKTISLV